MDQEKNSSFLKYFHLICTGLFVGTCFGTIMVFKTVQDSYIFELNIALVLVTVLLCILVLRNNVSLVFGLSMGLGMGLMGGLYFLKTTNLKDAFTAFVMIFMAFSINYSFLKWVRYAIIQIMNLKKDKNK